jgi:hypothetical protein
MDETGFRTDGLCVMAGNWCIAIVPGDNDDPQADNARLVAAAPDLLEALQYALPYLEACVPNPRNGINSDYSVDVNCVDRARAAIAKATGT